MPTCLLTILHVEPIDRGEPMDRGEPIDRGNQVNSEERKNMKAVIFDLDGTLLDTLEDLKNAVNAALEHYGMPQRTLDEVRSFVGNGLRNLMIRAVPEGEENPEFEDALTYLKEYYAIHCKDNTGPYPGIMELLDELKVRGITMAIVSNKIDSAVKELDKEYFNGYMSAAIGEMEGVARKPAPDTVLKALGECNIKAEDAIYVGDSDVDIATAKNTGLPCISVSWGFRDTEFLKEHGATTIIDAPTQLLELL